jgi:hypothetical protein
VESFQAPHAGDDSQLGLWISLDASALRRASVLESLTHPLAILPLRHVLFGVS